MLEASSLDTEYDASLPEGGTNGLWRSLVAHLTGGQGVAGSNPVSPTSDWQGSPPDCVCGTNGAAKWPSRFAFRPRPIAARGLDSAITRQMQLEASAESPPSVLLQIW